MADLNIDIGGDSRQLQRALADAKTAFDKFGAEGIRKAFEHMITFERATEALADALPRVGAAALRMGQSVLRGFDTMRRGFSGVVQTLANLHQAIGFIGDVLRGLGHTLFAILGERGQVILDAFAAAFKQLTAVVTSYFAPQLQAALLKILEALQGLATNQKVVDAMRVGFTALGAVIEWAGEHAGKFVQWLTAMANAKASQEMLASILALFKTLGEIIFGSLIPGVKDLFDPKHMQRFFPLVLKGIEAMVNAFFGVGRVWKEVVTIVGGLFGDMGDRIGDMVTDAKLAFAGFFAAIELGFHGMAVSAISTLLAIAEGINKLPRVLGIPGIDTSGLQKALGVAGGAQAAAMENVAGISQQQANLPGQRAAREAAKNRADPFRNDPITQRLADAFFGRGGRDISAQNEFWERFNQNNKGIQDFLFNGPGSPANVYANALPGIPPGPVGSLGRNVNPIPPMMQFPQAGGYAPPTLDPSMFNRPTTIASGAFGAARPADTPWWWGGAPAPPAGMPGAGAAAGGNRQVVINLQGMSRDQLIHLLRELLDRELFNEFPGAVPR